MHRKIAEALVSYHIDQLDDMDRVSGWIGQTYPQVNAHTRVVGLPELQRKGSITVQDSVSGHVWELERKWIAVGSRWGSANNNPRPVMTAYDPFSDTLFMFVP